MMLTTFLEGEAREAGKVVAALTKGIVRGEAFCPGGTPLEPPACLILGGETTVTLRGDGKGGRNQEMALATSIALSGWPDVLVVCLGTDGSDGPTDAAGAFADGETVQRGADLGLNAAEFLDRNDAYHFFERLGDLIVTGPTQTNVNDLIVVLVVSAGMDTGPTALGR
jgi:hydroxypyruvate reductase